MRSELPFSPFFISVVMGMAGLTVIRCRIRMEMNAQIVSERLTLIVTVSPSR